MTRPPPALFATDNPGSPAATVQMHPRQDPIPDWLVRRLQAQGHIDPDTGATRRAHMTTCPRCGRHVIIGFDGDPRRPHGGYMTRVVDPQPLTDLGEARAYLTGRQTYEVSWFGDHWEINGPRTHSRIEFLPASNNGQLVDVVVEHHCDKSAEPLPHQHTQIPDPAPRHDPAEPPF